MERKRAISPSPLPAETLDLDKLRIILRRNWIWVLVIIFITNVSAYLYLRWTKNLYEAESVLKLDIKQDATELGINSITENQNVNVISGEIEQIRSKLFLNRLIDSTDLWVSYHVVGKVLVDEMYHRSPFSVEPSTLHHPYANIPLYFNFTEADAFMIRINDTVVHGRIGQPLKLNSLTLVIRKTPFYELYHEDDYYFVLHSRANLLDYLGGRAQVVPLNFEANTIKISFQDFSPDKARDIVNKIDSVYLSYSNEQKNLTNTQKINWLNDELGQIEMKMEGYENYFENFTIQNKSSDLTKDLERTISSLYSIDSQRFQLNRRLTGLNSILDQFASNDFFISLSNRLSLPEYLNRRIEDLQRLQQERDKLGLSYNENTFAYKQKEKELETMRAQVFTQCTEIKKEWLKNLSDLNRRKEGLERQFATMPDKSTQFAKNQRFYKLYEEFYLSMMQSKAEFEIAQAGSTPDFKILSSATSPLLPISPKRMLVYGLGISSGLIVSIFFIGFLYLINNKITNMSDIERGTDVPVLGVIPESRHAARSPFHVLDNPKSMVSEAIRTLRTNLDFFSVHGTKKTISISSTIGGEGKSFLALNLGGVIAMSKRKVVLLDLDMRKPKYNIPFEIPDAQRGVSTSLIRKFQIEDCIVPTGLENFDFIPAGPHPPNPSELLMNGDFTHILDRLKEIYDFVIVDTPPVGLVTDGIMAMKKTDISIYVIRANYSRRDFLANLERLQNLHKLNHISVVFNALPASSKMYGYGYYEDRTPMVKSWKNFFR